ncbi:TRAP-like protein [Plasmodium berghei]|uniref:TRAP-like protein n=1 Tax=Plasmodium berghei TaxID=5821 RepID=A0A1D3Q3X1_PLABE|nr:TRAP-like protein [Plasmodium berghei]
MNIHFLISAEEVNSKEFLKHLIYAIMGTVNYMILSIGNVISVSIFDEKIVYKNIKAIGKIKKQSFASEIEEAYNKYVHYEAKETNLKNSIIDYHENVILSDPVMKNQKNVLIICKAFDEKDLTDYSDETVNFIRDKRDQNLGIYFISENTLYSSNIVYKLSETRLDEDGLYPLAHLLSGYYDNRLVISVKKFCYHLTYGSLCTKYNDWSDWFGSCEFRQRRKEIPLNITRTEASNFLRYYTPTCSNAFDYTISVKEDFKIDCPNVIYNCRGTCDAGYKFKPYVSDNEIVERYVECKDLPPCTEEQRNSRDEYEHIHIIKDLNDKAQETEYQDIIERRVIEKKRKGETEAQASARKVKEINAFIDNRVKVMLNKQYALLNINPPGYEEETKGNSEDLTDTRKISEILPPKYTVPDNPTLKKHPSEDTYSKKEGDNREAHKDGQVIKVIEKDHLKQNGEVEKKISETNNDSDGNITKNPTDIQILEKKQLKGNNKHTDDSIDGAQDWDKYEGNVIVENKEMKGIDKNTDKITIDNNMKVDNTYEMKGALIYTTVEREGNNGSVEPNKQKLSKEKEELESNKEKNEDKQIFPDKTKSETEKKDKEIIRDQELNKITQNGNVENIEEVIPVHETKTVEEYKPLDESRVVEEVIPVHETKTVEEYKPLDESRVVEEYKPLDESRVVEEVIPVHETKTVEEYKPLYESRVVEEVIPVNETKTVEEYKPLDESRVVEDVIPVNETKTVEEYKPLDESKVVEDVIPVHETKTVEEYKPLDESRVIEEDIPAYETKTVDKHKLFDESRVVEEVIPAYESKTVDERKLVDSIDANDIIGKGESIYDNKIIQGNDEWISDKDEAIENLDGYESTKSTNYSDNSDDNEEGKSIFPNKNIDLSTSNVINDQSKIIYTDKSVNKTINSDPNENIHTESRKEDIQKESENNKDMISHIPDDRIIHRVANNGEKKLLIDEKNIEDILGKDLNVDNSEGGSNEYNTIDMEHKEDSTLDEHNNIEKNDNNGKISEHSSEDKSYTIDIKVDRDTLPHDSINIQKTKDEAAIKKEEADTKKDEAAIKKEEVDIKKGEAAIKKYEVDIKKGEAVIKKEEADTKKDEAAIKKEEVDIKKDEAAIKKEEVDIKKDEAAIKKYEVDIKKGEAAIKKEEAVSMHNEIDPKKLIIEDNTNCPPNITTIKEKCDEVPKKSDVNPERTIIKDKDYVSTEKSNIEKNDVIDNSDDFSINEIISAVVNEHVNSNDAESKYDTNEKLGILDDFVEKSKKASGEKNDYPYKYYSDTKSIHKIFFKKSQGKIDENKYMIVGQNNYIIDSKDIKNPFHKNMSNNVDKILGEQIQKDIKSTFEGYNNDEKEKSKSSNNRILKLAGMSLFGAVFIVFMSMYMLKKINSYKLNENTIMNFEYDEAPKNIINNDKGEEVTCGDISYVNDDWS